MKLKSYFAESVEAAISQARQELGGDALLIYSRQSSTEAKHLGAYEVVFALPQSALATQTNRVNSSPPAMAGLAGRAITPAAPWEQITREIAELRKQVEAAGRTMSLTGARGSNLDKVTATLAEADADPEMARQVHEQVEKQCSLIANADALQLARDQMKSMFSVDPALTSQTVAFIGPPGVGKTTVLAKLAVLYGLSARRSVQIIGLDNLRVAGTDQLRCLCSILGIGFEAVETVGALAHSLEAYRHRDLLLIDTPGYGARDIDCGLDLAEFLASRQDIDTHLALTASMKTVDLLRVLSRFEHFRPDKLLFTKLDETGRPGAIWSLAAKSRLAVSFLTTGQRIPEDIEEASVDSIVNRIIPRAAAPVNPAAQEAAAEAARAA